MSQWQQIETAPKDRPIRVWSLGVAKHWREFEEGRLPYQGHVVRWNSDDEIWECREGGRVKNVDFWSEVLTGPVT